MKKEYVKAYVGIENNKDKKIYGFELVFPKSEINKAFNKGDKLAQDAILHTVFKTLKEVYEKH